MRAMQGEPSDARLLAGIAAGREAEWNAFFRRWAPRLGGFLFQATRSRETAEDLLQEAFLRVLRAAPRFEDREGVGAWLYRIAANLAYSHWRRRRVERAALDGPPPLDARDPEDTRAAWQAVDRLPENQRMVFLLKAAAGLTYAEIGAILGCPEGTAKSRFHHALLRLRAEFGTDARERKAIHVV